MALSTIPTRALSEQGINFRNLIINGDMSIAQRGTSVAGLTNGSSQYLIDRFKWYEGGAPTYQFTMSQDTDVPTGQGFVKSLKLDCTTAQTSLGAADQNIIWQRMEAQFLQHLKYGTANAESLTLSFWVKSNKTGTYVVELYQNASNRGLSKSYTINSANTWEKKTITYDGDPSGTINNTSNAGLDVYFFLSAGSNYQSGTLATSWQTYSAGDECVGQVNLADSTDNNFWITGIQLEVGTSASDFEFLPWDVNLRRCQRYLQQIGYGPYTDQTTGGNRFAVGLRDGGGSTTCYITVPLLSYLRTTPTITYNNINARQDGTDYTISAINTIVNEGLAIQFAVTVTSGFSISNAVQLRYTSTNGYMRFDSEL